MAARAVLVVLVVSACCAHAVDISDFWASPGTVELELVSSSRFFGPDGNFGANVGFQFVTRPGIWYLFHREYGFGPKPAYCSADYARIVLRSSLDEGRTWSNATVLANPGRAGSPDECALVDGGAFFDEQLEQWHYISQCLARTGGWQLCHFSANGSDPTKATWVPSFTVASGASVKAGQLWGKICSGTGKHCSVGMVDEGTPEIVKKAADGRFFVTFHGWDATRVRSARGVAATKDFVNWEVHT
jgi:hypothetical protein